jgi:hypothetical protein
MLQYWLIYWCHPQSGQGGSADIRKDSKFRDSLITFPAVDSSVVESFLTSDRGRSSHETAATRQAFLGDVRCLGTVSLDELDIHATTWLPTSPYEEFLTSVRVGVKRPEVLLTENFVAKVLEMKLMKASATVRQTMLRNNIINQN